MSLAQLFWETDSECEGIEEEGAVEWEVDSVAPDSPPRSPVLKRRRVEEQVALPPALQEQGGRSCPSEWSDLYDELIKLLTEDVGGAPPPTRGRPSTSPAVAAVDYSVTPEKVRAKLDLGVYQSAAAFEADILTMLLNSMVYHPHQNKVHVCARGVASRLQGILEGHGVEQSVVTKRLAGRTPVAPETAERHSHHVAHTRIVQKFIMLDQKQHFAAKESSKGATLCASSLQAIKENVDAGLYQSDVAVEMELRALFLNTLITHDTDSGAWKEGKRLLGIVTKAFEDNGLTTVCTEDPPPAVSFLTQQEVQDCQACIDAMRAADKDGSFKAPVERIVRYRRVCGRPPDTFFYVLDCRCNNS